MKKILIAGGTGFVGKHLISYLTERGYSINVLTREPKKDNLQDIKYYKWDIQSELIEEGAFEGVGIIINLTGANIGEKRWTSKRKKEILESRTKSIDLIFKYVKTNGFKINTFISSSAVGYYGAITSSEIFNESSKNGKDFLAFVCEEWEKSALQFESLGVKTVILRKGVIIGRDGGMYQKLAPLAKFRINTSLGTGMQYLPWMDIRDLLRLYNFILELNDFKGVFNAVASEHITMNEFSKSLLHSFGKNSILPNAPSFVIKLLFGEMSVMLLEGSRVSNEKLKRAGFHFEFDLIQKSLSDL